MNPREVARKLLGKPPNPGSDEAINKGCLCPTMDNYHGKGFILDGKQQFWMSGDCPLHGRGKWKTCTSVTIMERHTAITTLL